MGIVLENMAIVIVGLRVEMDWLCEERLEEGEIKVV